MSNSTSDNGNSNLRDQVLYSTSQLQQQLLNAVDRLEPHMYTS